MTDNLFHGRCLEYICCSISYYTYDHSFCHDEVFDNICKTLALSYEKLPKWFSERVDKASLVAGTGFRLEATMEEKSLVQSMIYGKTPPPNLMSTELYDLYKSRELGITLPEKSSTNNKEDGNG